MAEEKREQEKETKTTSALQVSTSDLANFTTNHLLSETIPR